MDRSDPGAEGEFNATRAGPQIRKGAAEEKSDAGCELAESPARGQLLHLHNQPELEENAWHSETIRERLEIVGCCGESCCGEAMGLAREAGDVPTGGHVGKRELRRSPGRTRKEAGILVRAIHLESAVVEPVQKKEGLPRRGEIVRQEATEGRHNQAPLAQISRKPPNTLREEDKLPDGHEGLHGGWKEGAQKNRTEQEGPLIQQEGRGRRAHIAAAKGTDEPLGPGGHT